MLPEISMRETEKMSQSLLRVSEALDTATQRGWTTDEAAARLFSHLAGQLGVEV